MILAEEALERLRKGNRRFVAGELDPERLSVLAHRRKLADGQTPFATVLGCSDSRVPTEIIFDQGAGDLFVIRVAGNIVAPSQIASVEYAAWQLGVRLVVVLGHTNCGAVQATLQELSQPEALRSPNLRAIVDRIRPAVEPLLEAAPTNLAEIMPRAVRANIRATAGQLRHGSAVLEQLVRDEGFLVVGAEYSLETGVVEFFDGL